VNELVMAGPKGDNGEPGAPGSHATIDGVAAGGDLSGAYPDPQLAAGTVGPDELAAPDTWHAVGAQGEPGFEHNWANAGRGTSPTNAAFTKDNDGVVRLRGQIKNGTVSPMPALGSALTLPASYRPADDRYFAVLTTDGANNITPGWVAVAPGGQVVVGVGNNAFVSIDLSFRP
jgi:hypothetical protein